MPVTELPRGLLEGIPFEHEFATELDGFYVPWQATEVPAPRAVVVNAPLAAELGLDPATLATPEGAAWLSGSRIPDGARPLAQAYAGHQFGNFVPQLGDGRAMLLGELIDSRGRRRDVHLKGSGRTPFSRGGDGKALLGPVLREYLVGEAMHAMGIPTSRALAATTTGERIRRNQPEAEPGAVLTRVAASHLRVGTFQFFAARGEGERVRQLLDYAIERHYPEVGAGVGSDSDGGLERALAFLGAVRDRHAAVVAQWMSVGFIHGVMNTDNMTISGETLDYGPCAFMDGFAPGTVFSSIDRYGRYAYGNQPRIAQWNLARLGETFLAFVGPDEESRWIEGMTTEIEDFTEVFGARWLEAMGRKIGISDPGPSDVPLIDALLQMMEERELDFTSTFRALADVLRGDRRSLQRLLPNPSAADDWLARWSERLTAQGVPVDAIAAEMERTNPLYIPRNHRVEEALDAAWRDSDMGPFRDLLDAVTRPFERRKGLERFEGPAPDDFGPYVTFCGT